MITKGGYKIMKMGGGEEAAVGSKNINNVPARELRKRTCMVAGILRKPQDS